MLMLAIGGYDVLVASAGTLRRLRRSALRAKVRVLLGACHFFQDEASFILEFRRAVQTALLAKLGSYSLVINREVCRKRNCSSA
jgi:hypothetical protein